MNPAAEFHPSAEGELEDAAMYYEIRRYGLGLRFSEEVEALVDEIVQHPESGVAVLAGRRRRLVPGFPYSVFYPIRHGGIRILAVAHARRRPFYWARRR